MLYEVITARTLRIQEMLAQARAAQESQQHHLASRLYQEVLAIDPAKPLSDSQLSQMLEEQGISYNFV